MSNLMISEQAIDEIFDACHFEISEILPSEWSEKFRFMTSEVSSMEGSYSFDNSPYIREIIDCLHPSHPCKKISIMKGAQLGLSTGFIENGIGWIMSENPGPILFLVGHDDLVEKAMMKVDNMVDTTGLRKIIQTNSKRARNTKTGDKDRSKEFPGGSLTLGPTNHKTLRQVSYRYGFIDDFEAMKSATKESGDTVGMIMQRFSTYQENMKLCFISTPELKSTSNIEPEYLKGDQRKFFVPCPCCSEYITLEWEIESTLNVEEKAGITWSLDESNELIPESVGYICQLCGEFFTDQNKTDILLSGKWIATAKPKDPDAVSFLLPSLYAPIYMFGWKRYVQQYLEANPPGQPRDESKHQTFVNLCLAQTYEAQGETVNVGALRKNIRPYEVGLIPEQLSINDGNGRIVMVTIGADMNGKLMDEVFKHDEDDARLDWEIVAWSETGSSYSVAHGSIGTFQPATIRNPEIHNHPDRIKYSYKRGADRCVWDEFDKLINTPLKTDTGRSVLIMKGCLDTAPYTTYSYPFVENNKKIYGIKGDKNHGNQVGIDVYGDHTAFQISKENRHLWILNVNKYKDILSNHVGLVWDTKTTKIQPNNFLNFPSPVNGLYTEQSYFNHYAAEHKIIDEKSRKLVWQKVDSTKQNHMFDCRIYAMAARDIFVFEFFKTMKQKQGIWSDFVAIMNGKI